MTDAAMLMVRPLGAQSGVTVIPGQMRRVVAPV